MADVKDLTININANTGDATSKINEVTEATRELGQESESTEKRAGIAWGNLGITANSASKMIANAGMVGREAIKELGKSFSVTKIDTSSTTKGLNEIIDGMMGIGQKSLYTQDMVEQAFTQPSEGVAQWTGINREIIDSMMGIGQSSLYTKDMIAEAFGVPSSEVQGVNDKITDLSNTMNNVKGAASTAGDSVKKMSKDMDKSSKSVSKTNGALSQLFHSMKRIIFYRMIRGLIKGITQAFKIGVQDVVLYSKALNGLDSQNANKVVSAYKTMALYVKNSLGSAVMPIINTMLPLVETLANKFVDLANIINQVFAVLGGSSTYTAAKKYAVDAADEYDKTNKSAKKLKNTILGFDEINALNDRNSGSGGSGDDKDYSKMFEEREINSNIQKIKSAFGGLFSEFKPDIKKVKDDLLSLFDGINFDGIKKSFESVSDSLKPIAHSVMDVIGYAITDIIKPALKYIVEDVVPTIANKTAEINTKIEPLVSKVKDIVKTVKDNLQPVLDWIKTNILDNISNTLDDLSAIAGVLGEDENSIYNILNNITSTIGGLFKELKPIFDIIQKIKDTIDATFREQNMEALDTVLKTLESISFIIDGFVKGDVSKMLVGVVELVETAVLSIVNLILSPINAVIDVINALGGNVPKIKLDADKGLHFEYKDEKHINTGVTNTAKANYKDARADNNVKKVPITGNKALLRANGGNVSAGQMFLAGERGAELVTASSNGARVSNAVQLDRIIQNAMGNADGGDWTIVVQDRNGRIESSTIITAAERKNRRDGRTIIPIGAY